MKRIYLGALFLLHFVCNNYGFSQGFQVNFLSQRQQGMGLAGSAAPYDASALFCNPKDIVDMSSQLLKLSDKVIYDSLVAAIPNELIRFSPENLLSKYMSLYQSLSERK